RSVSPDDVAGFLQCPIQQDEAAANCADIRRTTDRVQCRLQCSRKKLGVIVQEKQIFTPCFLRALIYSQKEIPIFGISDSTNAAQALQQARCLVLRIVIDDDDFHPLRVVLGERTQAGEGQFRTVEQNDQNREFRIVAVRQFERCTGCQEALKLDAVQIGEDLLPI